MNSDLITYPLWMEIDNQVDNDIYFKARSLENELWNKSLKKVNIDLIRKINVQFDFLSEPLSLKSIFK